MDMFTMFMWMVVAALICTGIGLSIWRQRRATSPFYTNHANVRVQERQVEARQIKQVIAKPDREVPCKAKDSVRLEREFNGRVLKVWVAAEPWRIGRTARVITTAWADSVGFQIPAHLKGLVIGRGGATIRQIETENGVRIYIDQAGWVKINSNSFISATSAKRAILSIVEGAAGAGKSRYRAA